MIFKKVISGSSLEIPFSDVFSFLSVTDNAAKAQLEPLVLDCIAELKRNITPRVCFAEYDYSADGAALDLGFAGTVSADLARHLDGFRKLILLAGTIVIGADRLTGKYAILQPSRGTVMQAAGAAAIESFLDTVCLELEKSAGLRGLRTRPRFSCGYGDLPLSLQRPIFTALSCEKLIGVALTDSFMMTPTKSVTAIVGEYVC